MLTGRYQGPSPWQEASSGSNATAGRARDAIPADEPPRDRRAWRCIPSGLPCWPLRSTRVLHDVSSELHAQRAPDALVPTLHGSLTRLPEGAAVLAEPDAGCRAGRYAPREPYTTSRGSFTIIESLTRWPRRSTGA